VIFVDASALVALLKSEPEARAFAATLANHHGEVWISALVRFEAVASLAVSRARGAGRSRAEQADFEIATQLLDALLQEVGARDLPLDAAIAAGALSAAQTYGKLVGHPAQLNMGDCFAHACAKSLGARLLYKGEDFAQTDLA
jgi:ribonuclease VapC